MFRIITRLVCLFALFLAGCSEQKTDEITQNLSNQFDVFLSGKEAEGFSGVALLTHDGQTLYREAFGKDVCGQGNLITEDDIFQIGSIVKTFTKASIYKLQDQNLLNANDPISKYFENTPADKKDITIKHLLDHTSGLPDFVTPAGLGLVYDQETGENNLGDDTNYDLVATAREEILERGLNVDLIYKTGEDESYSNIGFALLAALIEEVSGTTYEAFVNTNFFQPAGMEDTGYLIPDWDKHTLTTGCLNGETWILPSLSGHWMADGPSWNLRGNGGMLGTVDDLQKWVDAMRADLYFKGDETFDAFAKGTIGTSGRFKERATGGFGGNGIYNGFYYHLFDSNITLIMLTNTGEHPGEDYLGDLLPMVQEYRDAKAG